MATPVFPPQSSLLGSVSTMIVIACCSLTLLSGCIFARGNFGDEFGETETAAIAAIQKGQTTRAEVTISLGAPDEIVAVVGKEIFHYRYFDAKFGLFLILSRANVAGDNLFIMFDQSGIVEDVIFGKRTDDLEFQVWPFGN